nr:alpha-L-fucosidase [Phenylobacterium aquaticum]
MTPRPTPVGIEGDARTFRSRAREEYVTTSAFKGRPCPDWYAEPQLGIFIHWGMWAIPAWARAARP